MPAGISQLHPSAPPAPAEPASPWVALWQVMVRFDKHKVSPWMALRNSMGVALALIAGDAAGALSAGIIVSTGALNVAFSDSDAPYAQRGLRMLGASGVVGFAVFAGALCGHHPAFAVLVATIWAFGAGMLVSLSPATADLGALSLVVLVIYCAFPMSLENAVYSGLLAFSGGLLQTVLAVALWPFRRFAPERRAVGELYRALALAAASPSRSAEAPPATAETTSAQNALATLDHSVVGERYHALLGQAERIRLSLVALARLRGTIQCEDPASPVTETLDRYLYLSSRILSAIGNSLVAGVAAGNAPNDLPEIQTLAETLRAQEEGNPSPISAMLTDARVQMDAMAGQLRSACDIAVYATPAGLESYNRREARQHWRLRLESTAATLGANMSLNSAAFRHAIRLAVCIGLGDGLGLWLHFRRSYWLPMTIAIVLKPDFTATFSRGLLRLMGTFIGLVLATGIFRALAPGVSTQVALVTVFMFLTRCFGPANYGILVIAVTGMVVLLIALTGVAPQDVIIARGLNTTVGGAIAVIAYWLWPTWERTQVPEALAQVLDAYRVYFRAIRESYMNADMSLANELDRTRLAARRARSNFEASSDRLAAEPRVSAETRRALHAMLAVSHRLVHALMALESGLSTSRPVRPREAFRTFADHAELTLYYLAAALRGSPLTQADLPGLREVHHALLQSGDPLTERYALVNVETDRITNSLNTLSEEVLKWRMPGARFQVQADSER